MVVLLIDIEDNKGSGCNEGDAELSFRCVNCEMGLWHLLEISRVYNHRLGELWWMTFKDWVAAWVEVHAEVMRMDESFDQMWEKGRAES